MTHYSRQPVQHRAMQLVYAEIPNYGSDGAPNYSIPGRSNLIRRPWIEQKVYCAQGGSDKHPLIGVTKKFKQRSAHQLPSSHCGRSSQVVPNGSTLLRSASNSLLARTADRTPKTFALQGDPSRPTHPPSSKHSPYIVFPAGRDVTWNYLAHSWRIFSPNRDIEKIPAPLRFHVSSLKSPNLSPSRQLRRQSQESRLGYCPSSDTYPCKTLFPTIRLTLLGSDFPCL
ncbi:hypothetical protein AVEN_236847-1 [Araneus ventricosus]|uniref:Uncharacterized protein n=1 Tax=Araneus ventricosus TaxID=182803 RepID=A0A4Y2WV77_ARAVE|nr:hypothetical protein AVEN_236847-1 [Araneus ventricosus]